MVENTYLIRILEKLDNIEEKVNEIHTQVEISKVKFESLESRVTETENKLKKIDKFSVKAMSWLILGIIGSSISFVINKTLG